jgi:hypothetical protein
MKKLSLIACAAAVFLVGVATLFYSDSVDKDLESVADQYPSKPAARAAAKSASDAGRKTDGLTTTDIAAPKNLSSPADSFGSVSAAESRQRRRLADLSRDADLSRVIAHLNQSVDPSDWYVSNSLNTWCATVAGVDASAAQALQKLLGREAQSILNSINDAKSRCGTDAQTALSAPNLRLGEMSTTEFAWKEARTLAALGQADATAASRALMELGSNPDLVVTWLSANTLRLIDAPLLSELPRLSRDSVVALAMCAASEEACESGGLLYATSCLTSIGRWCTGTNLQSAVINSLPPEQRELMLEKSRDLLRAIRAGNVDALVHRSK